MRIIASTAFLIGGAAMWFLMHMLQEYGASQAAMSVGPVSGAAPGQGALPWLVCFYFAVSAIGVVIRNRTALLMAAAAAHLLFLFVVLIFCSGASGFAEALLGAGLALVVFSPWFCIWGFAIWGTTRNRAV